MSSIVLSSAVRQNLLALQNTASMMATTQTNLATGNKVNTALDNPTNFFTASGLTNRSNDIGNLLDGISNGVQVLQAANSGITSIQSLVASAKSIANQALQSAIGYSSKASFTSAAVTGATPNNILGTANSAGTYTGSVVNDHSSTPGPMTASSALSGSGTGTWISGPTAGTNITVNGQVISFVSTGSTTTSATGSTINVTTGTMQDVLDAINKISGTFGGGGTQTATINAGKLVINSGTTATGITIGESDGGSTALTALGLNSGTAAGLSVANGAATISASGTSIIGAATTAIPAGQTLVVPAVGNATSSLAITFGTGAGQVSTMDQLNKALAADNLLATQNLTTGAITISTTNDAASSTIGAIGGSATTTGAIFASSTISTPVADTTSQTTRANLVSQYNAILAQIDNTAADSSYNGVNLLAGDQLQLTFNETGKSKVNITGVQFNSAGLGLSSLSPTAFQDNNATNAVLTTLNTVSTRLRSQASAFGSNLSVVQTRQDFNKSLINVLQTGAANLTQADINQEAANSQALQTRQSLSVSALSLANQAQQSVLQLLR